MKNIVCVLFFLFLAASGFCQLQKDSVITAKADSSKKSYLIPAIKYFSDNIYLGRKSADMQSLLMPALAYYHKSGLFVSSYLTYILNPGYKRVDLVSAELGYEYNSDKFYGSAAFTKYWFNDSSSSINSSITGEIELSAIYDFNIFSLGGSLGFTMANKMDVVANPQVSKIFYLCNDHLEIGPEINLFAGTQYFNEAYYNPTKNGHSTKGRKRNNNGSTSTITVTESNQFKILDYELSLPLTYSKNMFSFNAKPSFIIPVHPATLMQDNVMVKETLENVWLIELGVSMKIGKKIHHV